MTYLFVLGDEVKEVDSFLIVYKYKDRFTTPFKRTLSMLTKMFGNFWTNVVLVVNFWSFKSLHVEEREKFGVTTESYAKDLKGVSIRKIDIFFKLFYGNIGVLFSSLIIRSFKKNLIWISKFH